MSEAIYKNRAGDRCKLTSEEVGGPLSVFVERQIQSDLDEFEKFVFDGDSLENLVEWITKQTTPKSLRDVEVALKTARSALRSMIGKRRELVTSARADGLLPAECLHTGHANGLEEALEFIEGEFAALDPVEVEETGKAEAWRGVPVVVDESVPENTVFAVAFPPEVDDGPCPALRCGRKRFHAGRCES